MLDHDVRRSLRGLPTNLADTIARHLVATALLLDDDPAAALAHARAAADRVPRLPAVREAVGIAAYHAGEYAMALVELRAARRMDGSGHNLPLMADSERGLGRPERAIAYLRDPLAEGLDPADRAEMLIVISGARRDLGQPEAAVVLLRDLATAKGAPAPWAPRLWYAYAEALLAAGRPEEAARWFTSAAAVDDGETDAAARAYEIVTGRPMPEDEDESPASAVDDDEDEDESSEPAVDFESGWDSEAVDAVELLGGAQAVTDEKAAAGVVGSGDSSAAVKFSAGSDTEAGGATGSADLRDPDPDFRGSAVEGPDVVEAAGVVEAADVANAGDLPDPGGVAATVVNPASSAQGNSAETTEQQSSGPS
jgi:tetratricopeptide (TPR) repeat protein